MATTMAPRQPITYDDNAILTLEEVARWLGIHPKNAAKLPIRCKRLGDRTRRYRAKWVIDYLEGEKGGEGEQP